MTFRILNSLLIKHLIDRTSRSVGGPTGGSGAHAYFLTAHGVRAIDDRRFGGRPRRLPPRGTFLLRHAVATADVALAFEQTSRSHEDHQLQSFECDWEAAQRLGQTYVVPDAYLIYLTALDELHAFVEVDLGTAGSKFFARKIANYLALYRVGLWRQAPKPLWPTVLVITPDATRATLLRRTTETVLAAQQDSARVQAGTEFAFTSLGALNKHGPLAPIWEIAGRAGKQSLFEGGSP